MVELSFSHLSRPKAKRPRGRDDQSLSKIIENAYEERVRHMRRMGIGLSITFMFLWLATVFVATNYPGFFGTAVACS